MRQRYISKTENHKAFLFAVQKGNLDTFLEAWGLPVNDEIKQAVIMEAHEQGIFRFAVKHESLDVALKLLELANNELKQLIIKDDDFQVFRLAAKHRNLAVMVKIWELTNPETQQVMIIKASNYGYADNSKDDGSKKLQCFWCCCF